MNLIIGLFILFAVSVLEYYSACKRTKDAGEDWTTGDMKREFLWYLSSCVFGVLLGVVSILTLITFILGV